MIKFVQRKIKENHFLYFGMPFISSILLCTYVVAQFEKQKWSKEEKQTVDIGDNRLQDKKTKVKSAEFVSLEDEYKNMVKENNEDYGFVKV